MIPQFGPAKRQSLDIEACPAWAAGNRCALFGLAAFLTTALGVGADAAAVIGPALVTGAGGALVSAATGNNPLTGGLIGAGLGGIAGATGAAGALNDYLGMGGDSGVALGGASNMVGSPLGEGTVGSTVDANGNIVTGSQMPSAFDPTTGQPLTGSSSSSGALNQAAGTTAAGASGATGGGKGISNTSLLLGALAAASALNKPKVATYATPGPSSTAATQGPLFNAPLNTAGAGTQRTAVAPNVNYSTYGENPGGEQLFFTGNQLALPYGSPSTPVGAKGGAVRRYASGGATNPAFGSGVSIGGYGPGPAPNPGIATAPVGDPNSTVGQAVSGIAPVAMGMVNPVAGLIGLIASHPEIATGLFGPTPAAVTAAAGQGSETNADAAAAVGAATSGGATGGDSSGGSGVGASGNSAGPGTYRHGGALNKVANMRPVSTASGDHHVYGPGGPEEDRVPARLSPGEYILDHGDITAIGRGSNARGAKIVDRARRKKGALAAAMEQAARAA